MAQRGAYQIVAEDPDDDAIVACAIEAKADVIVRGDGHLTGLKKIDGIRIVTPREVHRDDRIGRGKLGLYITCLL